MVSQDLPESLLEELRGEARDAAQHNYARYSGFLVVAAVQTTSGEIFAGTNIEVANYALTKHAEEMAIIRALATRGLYEPDARKDRWLQTLYVCGAAPCGGCRQFAWEWAAPNARCVIDLPGENQCTVTPLRDLLPRPFGPSDVSEDRRPARPAGGQLPP